MLSNNIRTITHIYALTLSIASVILVGAAPSGSRSAKSQQDFEIALDRLLNEYYDEVLAEQLESSHAVKDKLPDDASKPKLEQKTENQPVDIYDQMLGDQPVSEASTSHTDDVRKTRDKLRKDNWIEYLKSRIFNQLGKSTNNATTFTKPPEDPLAHFNISQIIPKILNITEDRDIIEKMQSFYPACEQSQTQDQDQWKDSDDIMDLSFNLDYISDNRNSNIATATLRLYRLPQNITNKVEPPKDDCKNSDSAEEEKLIRVSVYWYMKSQKKRRFKKRMSDSKVVSENTPWVELSVKPATKSWTRGSNKNLRLGILVEDQENKVLKADTYFKGASCTQPLSQYPPSLETYPKQTNFTDIMDLLGETPLQPLIVTYFCYPQ